MKQKILSVLFTLAFVLSLSACGSTPPPKIGHYTGTNPDVSFDITSEGIQNFGINMAVNVGNVPYNCVDTFDGVATSINPDGSFSDNFNEEVIRGAVNGGNVEGHYIDDGCYVVELAKGVRIDTDWTASYSGPLPTSTPILPPKLGHYTGSNPDVSFDVTSTGIENFVSTGTLGTGIGGCKFDVKSGNIMSINPDGSFSDTFKFRKSNRQHKW